MTAFNKATIEPCIGPHNETIYELIDNKNSSQNACGIANIDIPANTTIRNHYHPNIEEFYYMLAGKLYVQLGEKEIILQKGDTLHIPTNVAHKVTNKDDTVAQMLAITTPPWAPEESIDLD